MQGANADDCIPSWRILLCLVHSWKVRIAADPHANSPSQTERRRQCLAPNPHDALCRFCSPSRTHASNPHCCLARGDTSSHQFRDRGVFVVACTSLQTGHGRPECVDAIVHGRKIGIGGDGIFHKLLSQGVVLLRRNEYINLYNYYARPSLFRHSSVVRWIVFVTRGNASSRRHPCFLPTTLIGIITGKYEMMAGKRKKRKEKSRCSNDGDFGLRGRRFWRDENDGDSVPMTESWQVWLLDTPPLKNNHNCF